MDGKRRFDRSSGLFTLSDLGITSFIDANGSEQLSIQLDHDQSTSSSLGARLLFNPITKAWALPGAKSSVPSNNHVSIPPGEEHSGRHQLGVPWHMNLPDTEHIRFFRSVNWKATPLGPIDSWPLILRTFVTFLMNDNMAAAIYWGPEYCALYNPGMARLVSVRLRKPRDAIMGGLFPEIWAEIWDRMAPILQHVRDTGEAIDTIELDLYPVVEDRIEETFWSAAIMAIIGPDGTFLGYYNRGRETTKVVLAERRTKTLTDIASVSELEGELVWNRLFDAFRANERDFPMAFAYRAIEDLDTGGCKLELKQCIGLPEGGHALVPAECNLYEAHEGFIPLYRRAKSLDKPLILHRHNDTLSETLLNGFEWRGFGEPSRSIAIIAIRSSDRMLGFLVVGLNPRRPCDADYEGFLNSLSRHASAMVINALDREEAKLRAERLLQKLEQNEAQIRDLAVYGPVGMLRLTPSGKILWANDQFYEITGHGRRDEDQYELSFVDVVDPEDQHLSVTQWPIMVKDHQPVDIAVRLKRKWQPPSSSLGEVEVPESMWINAIARPIIEDGEVKGVAAAVTDISHFKWAEATQRRHAAAAKEAKRQQENFIDIVSHEMRNPLSAITQLADEISTCLHAGQYEDPAVALSLLRSNVTSAQTILLCAAHQKRIVDDVLTLSKLDAMMLSITPVAVEPVQVVETVVRMFDGEIATNKIAFSSLIEPSFSQHQIEWLNLDPSRLSQILINLISNAIKFTKSEDRRVIQIRTGATLTRPTSLAGVTWLPMDKRYQDPTNGSDWGDGEVIYLCFEIQDSGKGLEKDEVKMLFNKFQQATAKTHIKYGGSGLGLFISRELAETQGGEIGVESQPGVGSTFAFYIKSRRVDASADVPMKVTPTSIPPATGSSETAPKNIEFTSDLVPKATSETSIDTATHPSQSDSRTTVLLVEDNLVNAQVLSRQLQRSKVSVHLANHGVEALNFLQRTSAWTPSPTATAPTGKAPQTHSQNQNPNEANRTSRPIHLDFVLMDMEMPVMDGLTCTRRIREYEATGQMQGHMRIVAITANARQEQIDMALTAGVDAVMSKPFRVGDLLACMDKL